MTDPSKINETIKKCVDILSFILEAIPSSISELDIVFLFARTLETSGSAQMKHKSNTIYKSLHTVCKSQWVAEANTPKYSDSAVWLEEPLAFLWLADHIMSEGEYLIAKDCYEKYFEDKKIRAMTGVDTSPIHETSYLKMAKCCARLQNMSEALRYAEAALNKNHYHTETRQLLAKWSKKYAQQFHKELMGISSIKALWRGRCWTFRFQKMLRMKVLIDMEERVRLNHFDIEARRVLAYLAKQKWRAEFAYEDLCATKIQQFVRNKRKQWKQTEKQRRKLELRATETHKKYLRRPHDQKLRKDVRAITNHRFCPKVHPIREDRRIIDAEDKANRILYNATRSYFVRKAVWIRIENRRAVIDRFRGLAATRIQKFVRRTLEKWQLLTTEPPIRHWRRAAERIQRFVRWRNEMLSHQTGPKTAEKSQKYLRRLALRTLRKKFAPFVHRMVTFMRQWPISTSSEHSPMNSKIRGGKGGFHQRNIQYAAVKIQHFMYTSNRRWRQRVFMRSLAERKIARLSLTSRRVMNQLLAPKPSRSKYLASSPSSVDNRQQQSVFYSIPGFRAHTPAFNQLLEQHTVICSGSGAAATLTQSSKGDVEKLWGGKPFTTADCLMLCMVLKNKYCLIKQLVMLDLDLAVSCNPCFEFDLLPALQQCVSLNAVTVAGGHYTESFLCGLLHVARIDNPRLLDIRLEMLEPKVVVSSSEKPPNTARNSKMAFPSPALIKSAAELYSDYFNYSIPALRNLCLHGCGLRDGDIDLLVTGIARNSAVTSLTLSNNLVTDKGLLNLLQAMRSNDKTSLKLLDLSFNIVKCNAEVHEYFKVLDTMPKPSTDEHSVGFSRVRSLAKASHLPVSKKQHLNLFLVGNPIVFRYIAPVRFANFFEYRPFQLQVVYDAEDAFRVLGGETQAIANPIPTVLKTSNKTNKNMVPIASSKSAHFDSLPFSPTESPESARYPLSPSTPLDRLVIGSRESNRSRGSKK
mmetsp:Transcript_10543/g.14548  ORF Transcript_10543/g.14548 Transcript_10543/m.14548 type:complete len:976 (+) Transcript_10543:1-2928(+)